MNVSDSTEFHFPSVSITITKIVLQPDKYKPLSLEPVELEPIQFKRALFDFEATISGSKFELKGILEFRGRNFTLTDKTGANARDVALALATDYFLRNRKDGLQLVDVQDKGKICEASVPDADDFLGYIHSIKNRSRLNVTGEMLDGFALHKRKEFDLFIAKMFEQI